MSGQVQLADIMDTLQVIQATMTTMATKADLEALRAETKAGIDTLRTHTQAGFEALSLIMVTKDDIRDLRGEMSATFATKEELRHLGVQFEDFRSYVAVLGEGIAGLVETVGQMRLDIQGLACRISRLEIRVSGQPVA